MAILTFNEVPYTVDHAVKGTDYVHGYNAAGVCIVAIERIKDFSAIDYDGEYLAPEACFAESCNEVRCVNGLLVLREGAVLSAKCIGATKSATISVDATTGDKSIVLAADGYNTEWRYTNTSGITSLTIDKSGTFTDSTEAYYSVVFKSGDTATTFTNAIGAYFTGDYCYDGIFIPEPNSTYDVGIYWNGLGWHAIVRGV